jgi:hypothetical protein
MFPCSSLDLYVFLVHNFIPRQILWNAVFQRQSTVRNIMFEVIRKLNFVVLGVLCKTHI